MGSKAFANGQKGGGAWKNVWGQLDSVVEEEKRIGHCCRKCTWAPQRLRMEKKVGVYRKMFGHSSTVLLKRKIELDAVVE